MHESKCTVTWVSFVLCISGVCLGAVMNIMDSGYSYRISFEHTTFDLLYMCLVNSKTDSCFVGLNKLKPFEYTATHLNQTYYSGPKLPPQFSMFHCFFHVDSNHPLRCSRSKIKPYNQSACLSHAFIIKWLDGQEYFADDSLRNCSVSDLQSAYNRINLSTLMDIRVTPRGSVNTTFASDSVTAAHTDKNNVVTTALISTSTLLIVAMVAIVGLFVARHKNKRVSQLLCPERVLKLIHSPKRQYSVNVYDSTDMSQRDAHYYNEMDVKDRDYDEIRDSKVDLNTEYIQVL
ncbi:hypothetical protein Btru_055738 [Bulinus truncatus]|nr:hypothetical protein Btru_055738 [Bulinus truncatus]